MHQEMTAARMVSSAVTLKAGEDLGEDGGGGTDGFAEIPPEHASDPVQILDHIGPVQAVFGG